MIVLAGDIGGTKTWLQIADYSSLHFAKHFTTKDNFTVLFERRYVSAQYTCFDVLLQEFLQAAQQEKLPPVVQGCIGVAGPVANSLTGNDTANVTNLPWKLDAQQLATRHQLHCLYLINDFQAIAFGLEMLAADETLLLQKGDVPTDATIAPRVVIGAGTGLGQALLVWCGGIDDGHYEVISSEGGHADFAPSSDEQRGLLSFLAKRQARVSVEDVLSGRGLVNIYNYLADKYPAEVSETLNAAMATGDAAAAVGKAGLSATDSLAGRALDLFVAVYGVQAGNVALTCLATGGVYIAGGIAAKIQDCFSHGTFLTAFQNKGPMQEMMKTIPVKLVLNPQVGLKGAALVASRQ
ncbi:MAG: glucokinase [Gammaproteobacteria bacterium]|nr:glucokinase [Gammaproteobacteria bacterium]MCF6259182.1 glucokinase [Gammaproteobacteria bacterium]